MALHAQEKSVRAIATATGLARSTVRSFVRAGSFPERQPRMPGQRQLTPFLDYLGERWTNGCHNAVQLWRELRARGFRGGRASVSRLLQTWRTAPARQAGATPGGTTPATAGDAPRKTCWLLMANADDLTADEHDYLTRLCHVCPQVALAQALAREFHTLIRERDVPGLYAWLHGVRQSGIAEFMSVAAGIWRDRQAVDAALTHVESQGQTEGQVNRLNSVS
jgi:transposase